MLKHWFPAFFDDRMRHFFPLPKHNLRRILGVRMKEGGGFHVAGGYRDPDPGRAVRRGQHRPGIAAPEKRAVRLLWRMYRMPPCRTV